MAAALQISSHTFIRAFDVLPEAVREAVGAKVDDMGLRLQTFAHKRLRGRREFKLRVGDYRVLYEFDAEAGRIYLHYVGHRREIYKDR
jgi:mRNA interferase RelE/StbE